MELDSKLMSCYASIARAAGLSINENGYVVIKTDKSSELWTVNGKKICLPLKSNMTTDPEQVDFFNVLRENSISDMSEVTQKLRTNFNIKINTSTVLLMQMLISIATNTDTHSKLNPDQSEMLATLGVPKEDTIRKWGELMVKIISSNDPLDNPVKIFLKRGGTLDGKKYARVAFVSFPLYEKLCEEGLDKLLGVKLNKKDIETIKNAFKYIFPRIDEQNAYSCGINSAIAPFTEALMASISRLGDCINTVSDLFEPFIDSPEIISVDNEWVLYFDNLDDLVPEIKQTPFNSASVKQQVVEEKVTPTFTQTKPVINNTPPWGNNQQVVPQMEIVDGTSFTSVMRAKGVNLNTAPSFGWGQQQQQQPQQYVPSWARGGNSFGNGGFVI